MTEQAPLITTEDYEQAARSILPKTAYDYFRSGADEEKTLAANRDAFDHYDIWYRVLVDVSTVNLETEILGTKVAFPILVSPTAYQKLAHPEGEVAAARGAAEAETIYTLSTLATSSIEEVAAASAGPKWFQLYVHKDRGLSKSLIERAEAASYRAIVLTVDAPVLGRRLADERNKFVLPEGLSMVNLGSLAEDLTASEEGSALTSFAASRHDASLNWDDIAWIRSITDLPILIKGLVRPDDAERAVESGAAGVIVSNHGGRQLDGAPASIDALGEIADVVAGRCEVLMDGGVRYGTDVLKALALGAKAVMIGRPIIWGLAVGGTEGVTRVLELLGAELTTALTLAGSPSVKAIDSSLIQRRRG